MDCFLQDINYQLFYNWTKRVILNITFQEHKTNEHHKLTYQYDRYACTITFWHSKVIEQQLTDTITGEVIFYLHFEFINFLQAKSLTKDFIIYKQRLVDERRILIVCSCGITSSLFANNLNKSAKEHNLNYIVDAINLHSLENVANAYDYICLAPQIRYLIPKLIHSNTDNMIAINTGIFASNNTDALLSLLNKKMEDSYYEENITSM